MALFVRSIRYPCQTIFITDIKMHAHWVVLAEPHIALSAPLCTGDTNTAAILRLTNSFGIPSFAKARRMAPVLLICAT